MTKNMDYFNSICTVSRAFGTTLKKADLLELIVDTAIDTMDAKAACLFLADRGKDVFVPIAQKGLSENYLHSSPESARKSVKDLLKKGYLSIDDAAADKTSDHREAKKAEGIASILVVPVMVHDRAIGVLTLYTAAPRKFNKDEIAFLKALAEQGGIAIDRARLIEHIHRNTKLFHDLSVGINASLDVKHIMKILTVDLARSFKAKGVSVRLLDAKDNQALKLVASHGLSDTFLTRDSGEDNLTRDTLSGKTILIINAATDATIPNKQLFQDEDIVSLLSAPIISGKQTIGVLRLFFSEEREFYDDEIMMINAFAHQAGLAIQNATCFISLENDYKDLKDDIWSHRSWF
ncbi:MAG: GAF domain-containing protein [Desulfosalsimonadaceae bacterium]